MCRLFRSWLRRVFKEGEKFLFVVVLLVMVLNMREERERKLQLETERLRQESRKEESFMGLCLNYDSQYWEMDSGLLEKSQIPALVFTHNNKEAVVKLTIAAVPGDALPEQEFIQAMQAVGERYGQVEGLTAYETYWKGIHTFRGWYLLRQGEKESSIRIGSKSCFDRTYVAELEGPVNCMDQEVMKQFSQIWGSSEILSQAEKAENAESGAIMASEKLDELVFCYMVNKGKNQ